MSHFYSEMHQIAFGWGSAPDPAGEANAAAFRFNKWACGSEKTSIQSVLLWSSSLYLSPA